MKTTIFVNVLCSLCLCTEAFFKSCSSHTTCQECTTSRSWFLRRSCQWDPSERACHTARSGHGVDNQNVIKTAAKCFDLTPGTYNPTSAYTSALFSAAAYSNDPKHCLDKIYRGNEIQIVEKISWYCADMNYFYHERCFAYTAVSHVSKIIIVAFRGTSVPSQLLNELLSAMTIPKQPFMIGGEVQNYFKHAFDGLFPCINDSVKVLVKKNPTYQVIVTGHSLGGALASLASAALRYYKVVSKSKMTLYTFGQPRVGDREYAHSHEKLVNNSWRVVHYRDIVSHLPTCDILFGCAAFQYTPYHHGIEIFYPDIMMKPNSDYKECIKDEDSHCSDGLVTKHACIADIEKCIEYHKFYFGFQVAGVCKHSNSTGMLGQQNSVNMSGTLSEKACGRFQA